MIELTIDDLEIIEALAIPMIIIEIGGTHWGVITAEAFSSILLALELVI